MTDEVKTSGKTVTVACKMPNGLRLRLYDMKDEREASPAGTRDVKVARQVGSEVILNGAAMPNLPNFESAHIIAGGYGLTPGVDVEFFNRWVKDNKDSAVVKNGLIFAVGTESEAMKEAKGRREIRSNLEPLNPATKKVEGVDMPVDPRYPKPNRQGALGVVTDSRAA